MLITLSASLLLLDITSRGSGVLIGLYYNSIEPLMGMTPGIKAFVAAVLGGIGIIPGAALGGFVIGIWRHYQLQLVCQVTVMPSFMVS